MRSRRSGLLFIAVSQVLGKVGQAYQDDAQAGDIDEVGIGIEHSREEHCESCPQDGPDDKHMKLVQGIAPLYRELQEIVNTILEGDWGQHPG